MPDWLLAGRGCRGENDARGGCVASIVHYFQLLDRRDDASHCVKSHSRTLAHRGLVSLDTLAETARSELGQSASCRLSPWNDERAENPDGHQELQVGRETPRAVPAEAVVKEFSATRTQEGEDVLEVGCGTRRCTKRRRIEYASPRGEEKDASDAARHLKATRAEVLVRYAVAREVDDRPQQERRKSRPARRAGGGARGHMERDDHGCPS